MRVLGLDPGLLHTGWGIIDVEGNALRHVAHGVVSPPSSASIALRLTTIFEDVQAVISEHRPDIAAIEETFVNKNPDSTLKLGLARGSALVAAATTGMPVHEYAARLVKKTVVGTGKADKQQIGMMIGILLPGAKGVAADAADALAVAVCHAHHAATEGPRRTLAALEAMR